MHDEWKGLVAIVGNHWRSRESAAATACSEHRSLVDTYGDQFHAPFAFYDEDDMVLDYSDEPDTAFADLTDATVQYDPDATVDMFDAVMSYVRPDDETSTAPQLPSTRELSTALKPGGDLVVADPMIDGTPVSDYLDDVAAAYDHVFAETCAKGAVAWLQQYDGMMGENEVVQTYLRENDGCSLQKNFVEYADWSESKVSYVLSDMEQAGELTKVQLGRENLIALPGHEPDAVGAPDSWPEDA